MLLPRYGGKSIDGRNNNVEYSLQMMIVSLNKNK